MLVAHLELGQGTRVSFLRHKDWTSSQDEAGKLVFFSTCSENLGVPLKLIQGSQASPRVKAGNLVIPRVSTGESDLLSWCEGKLRVPLESIQGNQALS